jgi:hypothetical protein
MGRPQTRRPRRHGVFGPTNAGLHSMLVQGLGFGGAAGEGAAGLLWITPFPKAPPEKLATPLPGPFAVSHWARRFAVSPRMTANRPAPNLPSLKQQTALTPLHFSWQNTA